MKIKEYQEEILKIKKLLEQKPKNNSSGKDEKKINNKINNKQLEEKITNNQNQIKYFK